MAGEVKPTRETLGLWAKKLVSYTEDAAYAVEFARYALDLEREVERLRHEAGKDRWRATTEPEPPAPSPLLDDALWRRVFAAAAFAGCLAADGSDPLGSDEAGRAVMLADAMLAALREREGKP